MSFPEGPDSLSAWPWDRVREADLKAARRHAAVQCCFCYQIFPHRARGMCRCFRNGISLLHWDKGFEAVQECWLRNDSSMLAIRMLRPPLFTRPANDKPTEQIKLRNLPSSQLTVMDNRIANGLYRWRAVLKLAPEDMRT